MDHDPGETELRFATTAAALRRLPRCVARVAREVSPARTDRLLSVYWDTADLRLHAAGLALRLRRTADSGGWIQTLKAPTQDPHTRSEFAGPVPRARPDLRLAARLGWRHGPELALDAADLRPLFETRVARTVRVATFHDGTKAEIAVDRGEVCVRREASKRAPILEIELELLEGSVVNLYDLASRVVRDLPSTMLLFASKSDRGYALLSHAPPPARRARPIAIAGSASPALVASRAAAESLVHVQANIECAKDARDPEGVHQMRVGLRRLRVAGAITGMFPDDLDAGLDWLRSLLADARDLDVFATETWPAFRESHPGIDVLAAGFEATLAKRRAAAHRTLRRALQSRRFQVLMLGLGQAIASARDDVPVAARHSGKRSPRRLLHKRARRTLEDGRAIAQMTAGERHRVRIDLRKLRYLAEFFAGLYTPRAAARYIKQVAALQTVLGDLNDLAVSARVFRSLAADVPARERRVLAEVWKHQRSKRGAPLERSLAREWCAFAKAKPFW